MILPYQGSGYKAMPRKNRKRHRPGAGDIFVSLMQQPKKIVL
ncbi:hypothetical protein ANACOL_01327 [Anaerotruncus colihominis DSM 17241]|uniref:Uncharacterized protein n=1 Tax=Anaerotruncus colihominis DSM 17241 TaxID=445972 RepID=B0P980_9FIRM|nr:hypothetical protein ANACOL_01327 [Anaerotruncus colihominis DSM 17241]